MRVNSNKKGFSFLEVLVAMFIFVLVMVTVTNIFGRALNYFTKARSLQKDLENAQYTMNSIAKVIRTSAIVNSTNPLRVYDYSQCKCIEYNFNGTSLQVRSLDDTKDSLGRCTQTLTDNEVVWCGTQSLGSYVDATTGIVTVSFSATSSTPTSYGKVTIRMDITAPKDTVRMQTSVSLRNKPQ